MKKYSVTALIIVVALSIVLVSINIIETIAKEKPEPLKGMVIVIDPGHGGKDPGASSNSVIEDIINLSVSLKLREILIDAGASVILTRDDDYDLASENAENVKREDMKVRSEILNGDDVTLFLSIHCNISLDRSCKGAEVFYRIDDTNSMNLATTILERLREVTGSRYQPKEGDFYLLNNTQTLGALIEIGFLSNAEDAARLENDDYQNALAHSIYEGISDYFKILQ